MIRVIKRSELDRSTNIRIRTIAIILAFLVTAVFIALLDLNPISVYGAMLKGSFGSIYKIKSTIIKAIPLCITALGISIAFKMQFWNIGGEGQIAMGAMFASFFALRFPELPSYVLLPTMIIASMIGGGFWAFIPAILKAKLRTNETIITLMMNYIAIKWVTYLQYGPWRDPKAFGFPKIPNYSDNAILPKLMGIHIGWVFAIILTILSYIFINHTKKGYEIRVIGESEKTAHYAGINIYKTILTTIFISGALCGLTGMIQASAITNTLSVEVTGGYGFTAIIVAWLSSLSAPIIFIISILFAALLEGGAFIQTVFGIPEAAALLLQSMILFFVLGSEFFIKYSIKLWNNNLNINE